MRRSKLSRISVIVATVAVAACGPESAPVARTGTTSASQPDSPPPRARAVEGPKPEATAPSLTEAEIDALVAAWAAAEHDPAARRAAEERVVAGGAAVAERLVALLDDEDLREAAHKLLRRLGVPAIAPLLAQLQKPDEASRRAAVFMRVHLVDVWQDDPQGPAICRALLPLVAADDEDVAYEAAHGLGMGGPAARTVAKDIAEMWLHGPHDLAQELAASILEQLGTDAAPAAPIVVAELVATAAPKSPAASGEADDETGMTDSERALAALGILEALGAADPSILGSLRELIRPGTNPTLHHGVADVLRVWGDAGVAAAPELIALLTSGSREKWSDGSGTGMAAAVALCAMPSIEASVWAEIQQAYARRDAWTRVEEVAGMFGRTPAFAERLAALVPSLPKDARTALLHAFTGEGAAYLIPIAGALLRHPDADLRIAGLNPWTDDDEQRPLPDGAAKLLADPDASVRAHAAWVLAIHNGAPAATIRDATLALLRPDAAGVSDDARIEAIHALSRLPGDDGAATDALIGVLDGDTSAYVRSAAAWALSKHDAPIDGEHAAALSWLEANVVEGNVVDDDRAARTLLRVRGGPEALVSGVGKALAGDWDARLHSCVEVISIAGPRAAALRPALTALRERADPSQAREIDRALAAIDGDPEAIARTSEASVDVIRQLLALGERGRRAIVVLVGSENGYRDMSWVLEGVPMTDALFAAVRATGTDRLLVYCQHLGAVRLARVLPPAREVELLSAAVDADAGEEHHIVEDAVADELSELERRSPGVVPLALVERLLGLGDSADGAARAAAAIGPRAAPLAPALRRLRDGGDDRDSLAAAIALWRITGSADEALPTVRRVLSTVDPAEFFMDGPTDLWSEVAPSFAEMPLGKPELAAILVALRRGCAASLVPLLERFGKDAAPALPALRWLVARSSSGEWPISVEYGEPAVRVLGSIGGPARDAIPDLRRWAASFGDPHGAAREAIKRIESAPK